MFHRQRFALAALVLAAGFVAAPAWALQLRFPVDNAGGTAIWTAWVIGVDHDPAADPDGNDNCLNYAGLLNFPFCYDDHSGTDYLLNNGFTAMDNGSALVVAAADGVVVHVEDGHYDRCHVDLQSSGRISCDGNPVIANYIEVDHGDGFVTLYYHLMKNSMLVEAGDSVTCGQALARIGSSGISSGPHLHFQFEIDGKVVDPYAGPESRPESYWVQQDGAYGLPGEYCEGETLPVEDVVEPTPEDIVEPMSTDVIGPDLPTEDISLQPELPVEDALPGSMVDYWGDGDETAGSVADQDAPYWWEGDGGRGFSCQAGGPGAPFASVLLLVLLGGLALSRLRRRGHTR